MNKFQRNYILSVQLLDGTTRIIEPPFTLEFSVNKASFAGANNFTCSIYNLSSEVRAGLRHDATNVADYRGIVLQAGYGSNLGTVFNGNITEGVSTRDGNTWVTSLSGSDGIFALINGQTNYNFPAGTSRQQMIEQIVLGMPHITLGAVGNDFSQKIVRSNTLIDTAFNELQSLTNGNFSVQDGKAYTISDSEYLEGEIQTISAETGLLGTPFRSGQFVVVEMLFEPRIKMFQGISLFSMTGDNVNGFYKVVAIKHHGTISEATAGDARTIVQLSQKATEMVSGI